MPQARRSDTQRPRTAPASHRTSSSLDLGPLHQALPRGPLLFHQSSASRSPVSSTPSTPPTHRQQINGHQTTRPLPFQQRRTTQRPSTAEGSRRAPSSSPKGPSTPEGSRIVSTPTRWERPSAAESKKLFSDPGKGPRKPGGSQALAGRKDFGDANGLREQDGIPSVSRLPPDLLCQCFVSVESLYYLVNCASVCRAWREVLLSDMVWKTIYLKWWQWSEVPEDLQITGESLMPPHDTRTPPKGFDSWRKAFIARFQDGKKLLVVKEKSWAVGEGYLGIRPVPDTYSKRAYNCTQGDGMQKLAERVGLSFNVCLNRGRHFKIQGKGKIDIFQSSCILRYPVAHIGNLNLLGLKSIEVWYSFKFLPSPVAQITATSDRLLRVSPMVDFMVSMTSQSTGPLRLLQHCIAPGVSLIVGTLVDQVIDVNEINATEQVLLIVVSIHLSNLLWKLLDLGEGPTSQAARTLVRDELDPHYGLHNWHVSVQLHTFGRNIWNRTFKQVFWNERESMPGKKAVLQLVSHVRKLGNRVAAVTLKALLGQPLLHEVFPGVLKLPWKSEAFSGSLGGVYLLDITLWDGGGEIAWQHTSVARINPASLVVVEYGIDFDGEQVYTHILDDTRGINVALNMCIPLNIAYQQANNERPMIAITNLQVALTRKFLEDWCGVANI